MFGVLSYRIQLAPKMIDTSRREPVLDIALSLLVVARMIEQLLTETGRIQRQDALQIAAPDTSNLYPTRPVLD